MTTTYNTGNPIGSTSPKDLYDNASNLDDLLLGPSPSYPDRLGQRRQSWAGMEQSIRDAVVAAGYEYVGDYDDGPITIVRANQIFSKDGEFWKPAASLSLPYTTVEDWVVDQPKFVSVGDAALRQDLASSSGTTMVGRGAETLEDSLDGIESDILSINSAGFLKRQNEYVLSSTMDDMGNVDMLNAGIDSGVVRITVVGDSIAQGDSQSTYEDSMVGVVRRALVKQNPGLTFAIVNLSLAGRGIGAFSDPNFKGIVGPVDNPALGYYRAPGSASDNQWPSGSTVGQSWLDAVKATTPDLVVVALGANDNSGSGPAFAIAMKSALAQMAAWPKPPSIALVATTIPSRITAPTFQDAIQTCADVTRGIARELNHSLFDANRYQLLLRDAVDIANKKYAIDSGFAGFPTGWTPAVGSTMSLSGGDISGTGLVTRDLTTEDLHISATFTIPNWAVQTANIFYRATSGGLAYTVQLAPGGGLFLYYNLSIIASIVISPPADGVPVTIEAIVEGAYHKIYVNGALALTAWNYEQLRAGKHGFNVTGGSGTISNYTGRLGSRYAVGIAEMTDTDIFGVYPDDWNTNPDSAGGNGINHLTKRGSTVINAQSWTPLLHHFKRYAGSRRVNIVRGSNADLTSAFDSNPGQQLSIKIDAVSGPPSAVMVIATGVTATGFAHSSARVSGGRTVVCSIFLSAIGDILPVALALGPGWWTIVARGSLSRNSSGYANSLLVEAYSTP
jgi:hypothetical protein